MSVGETGVNYLVQTEQKHDTMGARPPVIQVARTELEQEHMYLLGRVQQLRRLLGYQPLPTGKQVRRERSE